MGVVIGIGASLAITRLISNLPVGVSATDPLTFVGVAVLLSLVALAATYIPAHRAMRVNPVTALRYRSRAKVGTPMTGFSNKMLNASAHKGHHVPERSPFLRRQKRHRYL